MSLREAKISVMKGGETQSSVIREFCYQIVGDVALANPL